MNSYSPRVLITGSNGQLGTALRQHVLASQFQLIACSRAELDITDALSTQKALVKYAPDFVVNTAAYTAVDKAESESAEALRSNHLGAQHIAASCAAQHIPLIHVSTDYIFDGTHTSPYIEEDPANPINIYGHSKWLGEQAVRTIGAQHLILRVSGVFSEYGNNFFKTILRLAQEKSILRIVADQITCPTSAYDIAGAIFTLIKQIQSQRQPIKATYHYCSTNPTSWHNFASAIIKIASKYQSLAVQEIIPITTAEYPTAAKRPAYSVLNCSKIHHDFAITQPHWENTLETILSNTKELS